MELEFAPPSASRVAIALTHATRAQLDDLDRLLAVFALRGERLTWVPPSRQLRAWATPIAADLLPCLTGLNAAAKLQGGPVAEVAAKVTEAVGAMRCGNLGGILALEALKREDPSITQFCAAMQKAHAMTVAVKGGNYGPTGSVVRDAIEKAEAYAMKKYVWATESARAESVLAAEAAWRAALSAKEERVLRALVRSELTRFTQREFGLLPPSTKLSKWPEVWVGDPPILSEVARLVSVNMPQSTPDAVWKIIREEGDFESNFDAGVVGTDVYGTRAAAEAVFVKEICTNMRDYMEATGDITDTLFGKLCAFSDPKTWRASCECEHCAVAPRPAPVASDEDPITALLRGQDDAADVFVSGLGSGGSRRGGLSRASRLTPLPPVLHQAHRGHV